MKDEGSDHKESDGLKESIQDALFVMRVKLYPVIFNKLDDFFNPVDAHFKIYP